jgi:hypothetical protein
MARSFPNAVFHTLERRNGRRLSFQAVEPPVRKKIEQAVARSEPGTTPAEDIQPGSHALIDATNEHPGLQLVHELRSRFVRASLRNQ